MLVLTSLRVHLFCYFSFSFVHRHTVVRIKITAGKEQGSQLHKDLMILSHQVIILTNR